MRKMILALFVVGVLFTGCSMVAKWTDAQAWCAANEECLADTKGYANIGQVVASPFGPMAGAGATAALTFLVLGILGLKRKPKE